MFHIVCPTYICSVISLRLPFVVLQLAGQLDHEAAFCHLYGPALHISKVLDLCENQITTLVDGSFQGLHGLTQLSLQRNKIAELPANSFEGLHCLEELSVDVRAAAFS